MLAPSPLGLLVLCHWYQDLQVRALKGSAVQAKNSSQKNNSRRSKEGVINRSVGGHWEAEQQKLKPAWQSIFNSPQAAVLPEGQASRGRRC